MNIILMRVIAQVFNEIVQFVAIVMADLHTPWAWSYKCTHDKPMDAPMSLIAMPIAQRNLSVTM